MVPPPPTLGVEHALKDLVFFVVLVLVSGAGLAVLLRRRGLMWTWALLGLPVAFVLWSVNLLAGLLVASPRCPRACSERAGTAMICTTASTSPRRRGSESACASDLRASHAIACESSAVGSPTAGSRSVAIAAATRYGSRSAMARGRTRSSSARPGRGRP